MDDLQGGGQSAVGGQKLEERIIEARKDIENIKDDIVSLKARVSKQGGEIDSLSSGFKDFRTDIALIKQATAYTETMLKEIKDDLKIIRKEREQDHYIKPLETSARLVWQVIGIAVALIVGYLMTSLFPVLH